jgi:hypothetical protein
MECSLSHPFWSGSGRIVISLLGRLAECVPVYQEE